MAQNKYALARYCLIDSLLHRYEFVKTNYIVEVCRKRLKCNITQRTIQMDIDAMKNDSFLGYFAPIEYNQVRKAYYYKNRDYQLVPLRFSKMELSFLQRLLILTRGKLLKNEHRLLENIVNKIKISAT